MHWLIKLYRHLNLLSIDVALGAVCCGAWFAKTFQVTLRPYALLSLGLTVWIIYTTDHLLDAQKIKAEASTQRHKFHQQHFKALWLLLGLAIVLDAVLIFFMRKPVLYAGMVLAAVVATYLVLSRWLGFLKEFVVAVLYCGGVLLPVLSLHETSLSPEGVLLIASFFITAWINVLLFAWFDHDADARDGYASFSVRFGKYLTMQFLRTLFFIQAAVLVVMAIQLQAKQPVMVLFMMNSILFLLFIKPGSFKPNDRYRLLGDAIFIFPIVFLLL